MLRSLTPEIAVAGLCGVAVGVAIGASVQILRRGPAREEDGPRGAGRAQAVSSAAVETQLRTEQLSRNILFFGEKGQSRVDKAFVVVVGLGGVGSHAAHMLARAGVGRLRLVDFDQVTLSTLNRHAVATREDVGRPKATVLREHLLRTAPWCNIEARVEMFTEEAAEELLSGSPAYVLDCIDDVPTKVALLAHCRRTGLTVLSSMGAGAKADPTRIRMGPLGDATADKLAGKVRRLLRERGVPAADIPAVFSLEPAVRELSSLSSEQKENPDQFGAVPNFRLRVLPVLGALPAIFGQCMAAKALTDLAGCPFEPDSLSALPMKRRQKLLQDLRRSEEAEHGNRCVPLDTGDIDTAARLIWRLRSALEPHELPEQGSLQLLRWDPSRPPTVDNVVLVTRNEANSLFRTASHDRREAVPAARRAEIEARLSRVRELFV